jgi:hypothetical protein
MKTLSSIILITFLSLFYSSKAQLPYTQPTYSFDSIVNIEYGVANNYAGNSDTLLMDIYRPIGDENCLRPIMILAHGGAWVVESKENNSMQYMARELAKRGWVVANINYRLGTNKAANYTSNILCNSLGIDACTYVADSAEVERANYRAMQDAKGAIRFMKSRNLIDSTDINNAFMAGESAGAFISLSAGFTDNINKKPASCYAIGNVVTPHPDLASLACSNTPNNLSRPDLGDIEGTLNLGTYDASLKGIGSFFGGVFNTDLLDGLTNPPSVYLFAQGSDVIVNYNYGPLFERLSSECFSFLGCTDIENYPNAYGGEGIKNYFQTSLTDTNTYHTDIVYNYTGNDCQANGHAIDNPQLRLQNMVDFFSEKIANSGNDPLTNFCSPLIVNALPNNNDIAVINPFNDKIEVQLKSPMLNTEFTLTNMVGKVVAAGKINVGESIINTTNLANGIYLLNITSTNFKKTLKLVKN